MSRRLAVSATFSVLVMAGFVLFGQDTAPLPLRHEAISSPISAALADVPAPGEFLPLVR